MTKFTCDNINMSSRDGDGDGDGAEPPRVAAFNSISDTDTTVPTFISWNIRQEIRIRLHIRAPQRQQQKIHAK